MSGAATAMKMMPPTMSAPISARRLRRKRIQKRRIGVRRGSVRTLSKSPITASEVACSTALMIPSCRHLYAGVERAVSHIDDEVENNHHQRCHQDGSLDGDE